MPRFSSSWGIADSLPDDHLVSYSLRPRPTGILSIVSMLDRHVGPELMRDLDEYFRHLARSDLFEVRPDMADHPPEFMTQYERVDPALMPLRTFAVKVSRDRSHYTFCVRRDMMSAALVREINEDFLPTRDGLLRSREPAPRAVTAPVMSNAVDALDLTGLRRVDGHAAAA